jgi:hypothetical protein
VAIALLKQFSMMYSIFNSILKEYKCKTMNNKSKMVKNIIEHISVLATKLDNKKTKDNFHRWFCFCVCRACSTATYQQASPLWSENLASSQRSANISYVIWKTLEKIVVGYAAN